MVIHRDINPVDFVLAKSRIDRVRDFIIGFVIIVLLGITVYLGVQFSAVQNNQNLERKVLNEVVCQDSVNRKFFAAIGDAFSAPPAPNPARTKAVEKIIAASKPLHNKQCLKEK